MGCSHSEIIPQENNKDFMNISDNPLDSEQVDLIKNSWRLVKDEKAFGIQIMVRLFIKHPEIKSKWIFANHLTTESEIRANSQVIYHAGRVISLISKLINEISREKPGLFNPIELVNLGKNHQSYGIQPSDFDYFEESLVFCLKEIIYNEMLFDQKMTNAWHIFYCKLVGKLCEGIRLAEMEEKEAKI